MEPLICVIIGAKYQFCDEKCRNFMTLSSRHTVTPKNYKEKLKTQGNSRKTQENLKKPKQKNPKTQESANSANELRLVGKIWPKKSLVYSA